MLLRVKVENWWSETRVRDERRGGLGFTWISYNAEVGYTQPEERAKERRKNGVSRG